MITGEFREQLKQALVKKAVESSGPMKLVPVMTAFVDWLMFPETNLNVQLTGRHIAKLGFYEGMRIILEARLELHECYGFDYQKCDVCYSSYY